MRYSEIDLQCEDIMWFGINVKGEVLAFTSGGVGCVPEFVCRSKEETERLETFFLEKLEATSECKMVIQNDGTPLAEDAELLSKKGLYVYDALFDDGHNGEYSVIAKPTIPINIKNLPKKIATILQDHVVECDEVGVGFIQVKHAY